MVVVEVNGYTIEPGANLEGRTTPDDMAEWQEKHQEQHDRAARTPR